MVLDTVHALFAPERLAVEAIDAAPFHYERCDGPGHGMEPSYRDLRLLERLGRPADGFAVPRRHRLPGP